MTNMSAATPYPNLEATHMYMVYRINFLYFYISRECGVRPHAQGLITGADLTQCEPGEYCANGCMYGARWLTIVRRVKSMVQALLRALAFLKSVSEFHQGLVTEDRKHDPVKRVRKTCAGGDQ